MKTEFLYQYQRSHALSLRSRLIAYLPRYAPFARRFGPLLNLRDRVAGLAWLSERCLGLSAHRPLPRWRTDFFDAHREAASAAGAGEVALFVDTFNTYFEPENARAALRVLAAAGYGVHVPRAPDRAERPLCCGRTFLAAGLIDEARYEARRLAAALRPFAARGIAIIGLEPSCLLTLRDEFGVLLPKVEAGDIAAHALLLEEFLAREFDRTDRRLPLHPVGARRAVLHGHCHQKAFGSMNSVQRVLRLIPELEVSTIESSCCGMAGAFGYDAEHYDLSMKMGELALLPAIRREAADTLIVADGVSCRQQIRDATGRGALHVARLLESALTLNT